MATSGSIALTATGTEIITEALEQLGVLADGQAPNANQLASCNRTFNYLVKAWQIEGMNLFALKKTFLFLQRNINEYSLSSAGNHWTEVYSTTAVDGAVTAPSATIDVNSIAAITDGDYIGIENSDGTFHWTTVNGAPSGSTVTLTDSTTVDISDDAVVYTYTTKANRPMKIDRAVIRDISANDIPVHIMTLEEYSRITPKNTDGKVTNIYYDPQIGIGKLFVWPETNNAKDVLVCWVQRTLDSIITPANDDVDFPQEWFLPLAFNLAVLLIPKYGTPAATGNLISSLAKYWKDEAEGWDSEDMLSIQPATQNNQD